MPSQNNVAQFHRSDLKALGGSYFKDAVEVSELDRDAGLLKNFLPQIHDLRSRSSALADRVSRKVDEDEALAGRDIQDLSSMIVEHAEINRQLKRLVERYRGALAKDVRARTPSAPRADLVALTAGILLWDEVNFALAHFQKRPKLRRVLNEGDPAYGKPKNMLKDAVKEYYAVGNHRALKRAMGFYQAARSGAELQSVGEFPMFSQVINDSPSFQDYTDLVGFARVWDDIEFFFQKVFGGKRKLESALQKLAMSLVGGISKTFGNAVGQIHSRNGKLFESTAVADELRATLKPGDILLEKTPFRVTDRLIPGYYGHVAMWLGTEQELRDLGVWDDPRIQPYQGQVKAGKRIVEALRPGVQFNEPEHFLDIDDLLVIRPHQISREDLANAVKIAAAQIGKRYDFNFDVETQDTLVCSELAFMAYGKVDFRLDRMLGRWTINPDAVAEQALGERRFFDPIILFVDGNRVDSDVSLVLSQLLSH